MLYNLNSYIVFMDSSGSKYLDIDFVNEISIESSWRKLTTTCKIILPRKIGFSVNSVSKDINTIIKRGSKVLVYLGYNGDLKLEFIGYVARIDAKVPFSIECEDEMWNLKQQTFSKTFRSASIKDIAALIWKGKVNVTDFPLGQYRIDRATAAKVLDDLQKNYNVYSYFTYENESVLNLTLGGYDFQKLSNRHTYNLMANVIDNDLVYRRKEENKLRIVVTSTNKKNVVLRTEVGDPEGEQISIDKRGMEQQAIQRLAESELNKLQFDGYKGSITGFGIPLARHNDIAVVISPEYPERDGSYMIDEVKTTFGLDGFRRQLSLGVKVN